MKSGRKVRRAAAFLSVSIFTWILCCQTAKGAIFDESRAVTYRQYTYSHVIEDSTLFIGTYLINIQALTDELYEKALDSAADSNQTSIYYKSELAGGAWFDITDATGLSDISDRGTVIPESELADLWVTCYTGSDGITRDARSGAVISIFDTPDPYDLYNLPELEPVRLQYENVSSSQGTGINKYFYTKLRAFFELNLRNEITARCDQQLAGLQTCYESLQRSDQKELAEIVSTLMSRIDARRRAEIFYQLSEIDNNQLTNLQNSCSGRGYNAESYDDKQFVENTNVTDAIGTSLQSCQESYIEHSGNMLAQGETVLKNAEYEKSMQVVNLSTGGWSSRIEARLQELQDLYHIQDDVVADAERELTLLDGELLEAAENKYLQILSQGAGGAYKAAVANGVSQAAKNQVLDDRKSVANGAKSEFQYLILAKTKRMSAADAVEYLYGRIEQAETYYDRAANDDFQVKAGETIDDHILWLQNLARSVSGEEEGLQSELQKLESRKEELLEKQADALDNNDLSTARKYEALIAQADAEISAMEQELNAILTSSSSTAAQKAQAANQAGDNTTLNNINQMKNSALSMIAEGNISGNDSLENVIDSLASLGAESALEEIRDKAANSGNSQLLKDIDRAIEDSKESSLHDLYGGGSTTGTGAEGSGSGGTGSGSGGTGSGSGGTGNESSGPVSGLSEGDIRAAIEAVFGDTFDNLSDADKAAAAAALNRIGQSGSRQAANLAQIYLNQCLTEGNGYIFQKLQGESGEFIPLRLIGLCSGYRYVYSDSRREVTLTKKSNVCRFTAYSDRMARQDGSEEKLTASVKVQNVPYLAEEDAIAFFRCQAEYIDTTDYGVALSAQMQKRVQELVDALQEGEG
ncbi:MAG: hypothetical protein K2J60_02030 [Acetatifactor sp.]|nr:hypothetical protein [Acetatifactor sp.]